MNIVHLNGTSFYYQPPVGTIIFQCQSLIFEVQNLLMNEFWYLDIKHPVENVKASINGDEDEQRHQINIEKESLIIDICHQLTHV